jgi:hypothetical protein
LSLGIAGRCWWSRRSFAIFAYLSVLVVLYAIGLASSRARAADRPGVRRRRFRLVLLIWRFVGRRPIRELA